MKTFTGIQSPTITISRFPSLLTSAQAISVIIPMPSSPGAILAVTSLNIPCPSFCRRYPFAGKPYSNGRRRIPTNRSIFPSLLKSAGLTHEVLSYFPAGNICADLTKFPLPSFMYKRSARADELDGNSFPPLATYKSRSPSPSASNKAQSASSQILSASNNASFVLLKCPFLSCI